MILRKQIIGIMAFVGIIGSCNAQTEKQSSEEYKEEATNHHTEPAANKQSSSINFIDNNDIKYGIAITTNPPTEKDGKIYTGGWWYRVRVENITEIDIEKFKKIPSETWLQLLEDENTDWAANLILYDIYNRDAIILSKVENRRTWIETMKKEDIDYWKESLSKKR